MVPEDRPDVPRIVLATMARRLRAAFVAHTRHPEVGHAGGRMPIRARHRSSRVTARALLLLSVAALVALVAGCGSPEYTYVTNSTDRTYLKVPTTWRQIDGK